MAEYAKTRPRAGAGRVANRTTTGTIATNASVGCSYFWREPAASRVVCARITGTFVGTIAVQIADAESDLTTDDKWATIESYTTGTSQNVTIPADCDLRIKSTAWTSGTAYVSLSSLTIPPKE